MSPGTSHILWLVGHIAWSLDTLLIQTLSGTGRLGPDYSTKFGMGARPVPESEQYPLLEEVLIDLERCVSGAVELLESRDDSLLEEELSDESMIGKRFKTVGNILGLAPVHIAYHTGQVTMLRRAQGLESGLGV